VHCASGVKSLTRGLKSMSEWPASLLMICSWQLARSCSVCVLVKSVIERFLVFADPNGPVTKAAGMRVRQEPIDTHHVAQDHPTSGVEVSSGRDSCAGATNATGTLGSDAAKRGSALTRQESGCLRQAWSPGGDVATNA